MTDAPEHTEQNLAEVGLKLRAAREAKGMGLGELSANTRINRSYLEAIEAGDSSRLPAITFVRGFIRNYAAAVGLSDAELAQHLQALGATVESDPASLEPPAEVHPEAVVTLSLWRVVLAAAIVVALGFVGYFLLTTGSETPETAMTETAAEAPGTPAEAEESTGRPPPPSPLTQPARTTPQTPSPPAAVGPALPDEPPAPLQLTLRGEERAWVRLSVDRAEPVDVFLSPAESAAWEANEEFRLTLGKSHGVSIFLNGEEILIPGDPNTLVPELVLNRLTLLKLEN